MKIDGFGDYDFSEEEIANADNGDGTMDGFYLYALAMYPLCKKAGWFEDLEQKKE